MPPVSPQNNPAPAAPGEKPKPPMPNKSGNFGPLFFIIIGVAVFGALLFFFGILPRFSASAALDKEQKLSGQRNVIFAQAHLAAPKVILPLPGTIEAYQQASLYARTNGYVKRWNVDIGDIVHTDDVLAELDTPEVDHQLAQAKSTAQQAKAAVDIAQIAADRWGAMVKARAVSQQEADEKNATLNEAKATYDADQANVAQLTSLENFKRIAAPFPGKITFRNIEVGNLVTAPTGSNANTSGTTELFRIAQTDPLRVYVDVPEANTRAIKPGVMTDLYVQAYPDRVFHGEVVRSAGALDRTSRTLRTEIRVANPDGALLPGAFAEVRMNLVDDTPSILIPANTLIVNSSGTQVALIENTDNQDKIHYMPVKVGRDFGTEVEIQQDLKDGDRLVTNPPADMTEGEVVNARPMESNEPSAPANPAPKS